MSTSVRIELDNRGSVFTCLDNVTGRVVLHVASQETISTITVKMEGVSRTRLFVPNDSENDPHSRRAETEIHKLLYVVDTVFPSPEILLQRSTSSSPNSSSHLGYTLSHGTYEYRFRLRIPINNKCRPVESLLQKLSIEKGKVDYARDGANHAEQILPPSLFGLPGGDFGEDATVKYFLKVTVNRPQFYRTNLRTEEAFVFLPIEPPRPAHTGSEVFARRQHSFVVPSPDMSQQKKGSIWSFKKKEPKPLQPVIQLATLPALVEARLPAPAILTPMEPLGLRLLVTKLEACEIPIYIHQLSLRLVINTYVTAHTQRRKLTTTIPLHNTQIIHRNSRDEHSLALPTAIEDGSRPLNSEIEIDRRIWDSWTLPDNICPSFSTCNITRTYQLQILINLSCGKDGIQDQIPLIIPVQIYSGIRPPAKLLERMTSPNATSGAAPSEIKDSIIIEDHSPGSNTPTDQVYSSNALDLVQQPQHTDAPPAYEDVVLTAEDNESLSADGPHNRNRQYPIQQGYFSEPITEHGARGGSKN